MIKQLRRYRSSASLRLKVSAVVSLPVEDSGLSNAIVRVHNSRIDRCKKDKQRFFRREPLVIMSPETGAFIVRYAMGGGGVKGVCRNTIALDYDGIDALGIRFNAPVELLVRRASTIEVYRWFWQHPALSVQLSVRLGVVGAVLGVMGFLTGIVSFL